jgi:hypothetical protein
MKQINWSKESIFTRPRHMFKGDESDGNLSPIENVEVGKIKKADTLFFDFFSMYTSEGLRR